MLNKSELRKRNKQLRHKLVMKVREENNRKKQKALREKETQLLKVKSNYPEFILTLNKRLKRIDPWDGVAAMNYKESVVVSYFKLKQLKIDNIKIGINNVHGWLEFKYNDVWWIFDPIAVKNKKLGDPIKKKSEGIEYEYKTLSKYYESYNDYKEDYENDLLLTTDEYKILAMKDTGLNTLNNINYH